MQVKDILRQLDLGNSVAEFDESLEKYFVETKTFYDLVNGRYDIIAGDKGTGKTALFRILTKRYRTIAELSRVEVVPAFNPIGNPIFQRLTESEVLDEGQYIIMWKTYILCLTGNWILQIYEDDFTDEMKLLEELLRKMELRSSDPAPVSIFSRIVTWLKTLKPKSIEAAFTYTKEGLPIVTPKIEFDKETNTKSATSSSEINKHDVGLSLVDTILRKEKLSIWLVLDRLDEAFQGFPKTELPALRALFRAYLDLLLYNNIRLKIFVRRDLFRRIIVGGFVNLTHINAKKIEIIWDDEDLRNLIIRRVKENHTFFFFLGIVGLSSQEIFESIFPSQVDPGERQATTWTWMMSRIRDGNHVKPPRNLIDLVVKAQNAQLRKEDREGREYQKGNPIINSESLKRGLSSLSEQRVQDTLLAEAGDKAELIIKFRDGKSEYNDATLLPLLGGNEAEFRENVKALMEIGFLEQVGESHKIPILYRDGLRITQGKAF